MQIEGKKNTQAPLFGQKLPFERKDEVFSHARPEPSGAYEPELSISI
jgi:hypothetical protein